MEFAEPARKQPLRYFNWSSCCCSSTLAKILFLAAQSIGLYSATTNLARARGNRRLSQAQSAILPLAFQQFQSTSGRMQDCLDIRGLCGYHRVGTRGVSRNSNCNIYRNAIAEAFLWDCRRSCGILFKDFLPAMRQARSCAQKGSRLF